MRRGDQVSAPIRARDEELREPADDVHLKGSADAYAEAPPTETFSIGCFEFGGTGVEVHGRPTYQETQGAFDFVTRVHKQSGFWLADMILYIESREDFGDRRDALISADLGITEQSVRQYRYVGKHVPPASRVAGVAFGHHAVVANLKADEQVEWLEKSKAEGWTQAELKTAVRTSRRVKLIDGQAPGVWSLAVEVEVDVEAPTLQWAEKRAREAVTQLLQHETASHILGTSVGTVRLK